MKSDPADELVRLACVDYERWRFTDAAKAERMLDEDPALARHSIWTAAAAGDVDAAREILEREPALVNAKGGPYGWEPLLYACYSRVGSTLNVARLLLERGADPNASYLWHGNVPPFTALTGAFGEGEDDVNQPPHLDCEALARLLLDAGANPNDGQTLYNRHFKRSDDHLKLLFEYGLDDPKLLAEELWSAARRNRFERVKLLVEHGADVNARGIRDGRTPYEAATRFGNFEIAEYLVQHGATKSEMSPRERFAATCIAGRRDEVSAEMFAQLSEHERIELVHRAVEARSIDGVRLLAELGIDMSGMTRHDSVGINLAATPLHNATGDLAMMKRSSSSAPIRTSATEPTTRRRSTGRCTCASGTPRRTSFRSRRTSTSMRGSRTQKQRETRSWRACCTRSDHEAQRFEGVLQFLCP